LVSKVPESDIFHGEFDDSIDLHQNFEQPDWFDEEAYLVANPDVLESVTANEFSSAYHHYILHGREEGRPLYGDSAERRNCLVRSKPTTDHAAASGEFRASLEVVMISPRGGLMVVGWVDDMSSPLEWIKLSGAGWYMTLTANRAARFRRPDVEGALGAVGMHSFGFFTFAYTADSLGPVGVCRVTLGLSDSRQLSYDVPARRVSEVELRNTVLTYLSEAELFGNRQVEAVRLFRGPLGGAIVKHNRDISRDIVAGAYVERFGPRGKKLRGSLVVCLYGKPEYLFLQNALFTGGTGFDDYEMIYVSNSPELAEKLIKDMRIGTQVYGLTQTLVLLPGNAGFGAANNVAVNYASTDRILIVNPDVFPRDEDWARGHTHIITNLPKSQTELFGVPLYYDDGTLMHGGMHFEYDTGLTVDKSAVSGRRMVRVEHYGKGAPAWSAEFTRPRPVPAVSGAFISLNRAWYEKLGGFTEDFIFGHYEDADLCLKSISAGVAPWMHDIRLWHLEGKGSIRLPVHEGGSYVNRAIFSERWDGVIAAGLEGRSPSHPLMQEPAKIKTPLKSDLSFPGAAELKAAVTAPSPAPKTSSRPTAKSSLKQALDER
jgi:GT2 family glycosyltransferase